MKISLVFCGFVAFTALPLPTSARLATVARRLRAEDRGGSYDDGANDTPPDYLSMPTDTDVESPSVVNREVCIVGGGPSGTYAAHLLEQKGYNVALFDEAHRLGGKTVPPGEDEDSMFRHALTADMVLVNEFVEKYGLGEYKEERKNLNLMSTEPPFTISSQKRDNWFENMLLGAAPGLTPDATLAGLRYAEIWNEHESSIKSPNHDSVPEELMMPADEWLAKNNVMAIREHPLFYNGLSNYGYSYLNSIPAIYVLKYVTPTKMREGGHTWFPMHLIFESMGSGLSDVHSNTRVEQIQQLSGGSETWTIHAKKNSIEDLDYNCDNVVLAFPPTAEALGIVSDLDPVTKELFTNVNDVAYWEAVLSDLPDCPSRSYTSCLAADNFYFKNPPVTDRLEPTHDIPNVYFQPHRHGDAVALFNGAGQEFSQEGVFDIIRGHLHAAFGYEPDSYNLELYQKWPYFPHVSSAAMTDGFYDDLEEVQGRQNLFFTGGFRDFELVDNSMRTTEDLLGRYFTQK